MSHYFRKGDIVRMTAKAIQDGLATERLLGNVASTPQREGFVRVRLAGQSSIDKYRADYWDRIDLPARPIVRRPPPEETEG